MAGDRAIVRSIDWSIRSEPWIDQSIDRSACVDRPLSQGPAVKLTAEDCDGVWPNQTFSHGRFDHSTFVLRVDRSIDQSTASSIDTLSSRESIDRLRTFSLCCRCRSIDLPVDQPRDRLCVHYSASSFGRPIDRSIDGPPHRPIGDRVIDRLLAGSIGCCVRRQPN